jgi:hypothetical protein
MPKKPDHPGLTTVDCVFLKTIIPSRKAARDHMDHGEEVCPSPHH